MSRFQFVADHSDTFEVKWLCAVVEVARSSFYAWLAAADTRAAKTAADEDLEARIRTVHTEDNTYGAPRITAELNDGAPDAERVNHKRVARVMRTAGIAGYRRKRRVKTTVPDPANQKVPDLLGRDFTAAAPNTTYVGDSYADVGIKTALCRPSDYADVAAETSVRVRIRIGNVGIIRGRQARRGCRPGWFRPGGLASGRVLSRARSLRSRSPNSGVVSMLSWPSQSAITLVSTPASRSRMAAVCRNTLRRPSFRRCSGTDGRRCQRRVMQR